MRTVPKSFVSIDDAAWSLGVDIDAVEELVRSDQLTMTLVNGNAVIPTRDLAAFIDERREATVRPS